MDEDFDNTMQESDEQLPESVARWDSAPMLAKIAREHFKSFADCNTKAEELNRSPGHASDHGLEPCFVCHQMDELSSEALQHGIVVVTFSAFALEAHINEYGSRKLTSKHFEIIEKLSPVHKWILIPRLVCGNEIDRGSQAYQCLDKLFGFRNKIVHSKARDVDFKELKDGVPFGIREQNQLFEFVPRAIRTLDLLSDEARRLDSADPLFGRFLR